MTRKLLLANFEYDINPATWHTAEDLLPLVRHLQETEKHLWVAKVETDTGVFETEVSLSAQRIKAFTCECFADGRQSMCVHVAATLLRIRQFLAQKVSDKARKRAEKAQTEPTERFTVQAALKHADPTDLADFVRDYARRDRDFALALRVHFAAALEVRLENPWELALDAAISPKSTQVTQADLRRLEQTVEQLEAQMDTALPLKNYQMVFQVSAAILLKINALMPKTKKEQRSDLVHMYRDTLARVTALPEALISPELRDARWELLLEQGREGHYPAALLRDFLPYFLQQSAEKIAFERLQKLFYDTPNPVPPFVLHVFVAALLGRGLPEAVCRVLEDGQPAPELLDETLTLWVLTLQHPALLPVLEYFLGKTTDGTRRRKLTELGFELAKTTGDRPRQMQYFRQRFAENGHTVWLDEIKSLSGAKWPAERDKLLQKLQKDDNPAALAALYASENQWGELAELLENKQDMPLLQRYEDWYLDHNPDFVRGGYAQILTGYLEGHFGPPSLSHVRLMLANLLEKGQADLVVALIRTLAAHFPERPSMNDELAELFPKSKRKALFQV